MAGLRIRSSSEPGLDGHDLEAILRALRPDVRGWTWRSSMVEFTPRSGISPDPVPHDPRELTWAQLLACAGAVQEFAAGQLEGFPPGEARPRVVVKVVDRGCWEVFLPDLDEVLALIQRLPAAELILPRDPRMFEEMDPEDLWRLLEGARRDRESRYAGVQPALLRLQEWPPQPKPVRPPYWVFFAAVAAWSIFVLIRIASNSG